MASNKHFSVDIRTIGLLPFRGPSYSDLLRFSEGEETLSPFGNKLKKIQYLVDKKGFWILPREISELNLQNLDARDQRYVLEEINSSLDEVREGNTFFELAITFDSPLVFTDINPERFLYSFGRGLQASLRLKHSRNGSGHIFIRSGTIEEGSIKINIGVGLWAAYSAISMYPDFVDGLTLLTEQTSTLSSAIERSIRASKVRVGRPTTPDYLSKFPLVAIRDEFEPIGEMNRSRLFNLDDVDREHLN